MIWGLGTRLLHLLDPETAHRLTNRKLRLGVGNETAPGDNTILDSLR